MAVTHKFYGKVFLAAFNKEIDLDSDDIRGALVTSSYSFDQDAHDYWNDITNELSTGSGYTANGKALTSVTASYTGGTNVFAFTADPLAWSSFTGTARGLVIYDRTPGTDATRPLIAFVDFGADVSVTAGTLTVTWNAAGIATVTVS